MPEDPPCLLAGPYPWGAYRTITVRDPKPRVIRAAPFADRVLHHAIGDLLDPFVRRGFIDDTYACLPDRGSHVSAPEVRGAVVDRELGRSRVSC